MDSSISSEKEWEVCNKKMKNIKQYLDLTFWKFILVGIINTLVGTTVMFVAYNLCHLNYWVSSASNYVVGSIVSYFLNKYFTFQDKKKSWRQVGIFVVNITICWHMDWQNRLSTGYSPDKLQLSAIMYRCWSEWEHL